MICHQGIYRTKKKKKKRPAIKAPVITILPEFSALIYLPPKPRPPHRYKTAEVLEELQQRMHTRTHAHTHMYTHTTLPSVTHKTEDMAIMRMKDSSEEDVKVNE